MHDGPGSFKSVPALEHLAVVSELQNKLDQAISFQDTALRLTQAQPNINGQKILNAQLTLADLLVEKKDYSNAESVLSDSVAMCNTQVSIPNEKRATTFKRYAIVLRQLHKDSEADAIEAANANNSQQAIGSKNSDNPLVTAQAASGPTRTPQH